VIIPALLIERDATLACRVPDCDSTVRYRRGLCSSCYGKWKHLNYPDGWPVLPKARTGPKPGAPQARLPKLSVAPSFANDEDSVRRSVRVIHETTVIAKDDLRTAQSILRQARSRILRAAKNDHGENMDALLGALAKVQQSVIIIEGRAKRVLETRPDPRDEFNRFADREDTANPEDELEYLRGGGARVLAKARVS
jgi:hypothetical protein